MTPDLAIALRGAARPELAISGPVRLIDSLLESSRIWVALAARGLSATDDDVTLRQFRALVVLDSQGQVRLTDLARALSADASTASRLCDQLVKKGLIIRRQSPTNRREVQIELSDEGVAFLHAVNDHRRTEVEGILRRLPAGAGEELLSSLRQFALAAEAELFPVFDDRGQTATVSSDPD